MAENLRHPTWPSNMAWFPPAGMTPFKWEVEFFGAPPSPLTALKLSAVRSRWIPAEIIAQVTSTRSVGGGARIVLPELSILMDVSPKLKFKLEITMFPPL